MSEICINGIPIYYGILDSYSIIDLDTQQIILDFLKTQKIELNYYLIYNILDDPNFLQRERYFPIQFLQWVAVNQNIQDIIKQRNDNVCKTHSKKLSIAATIDINTLKLQPHESFHKFLQLFNEKVEILFEKVQHLLQTAKEAKYIIDLADQFSTQAFNLLQNLLLEEKLYLNPAGTRYICDGFQKRYELIKFV